MKFTTFFLILLLCSCNVSHKAQNTSTDKDTQKDSSNYPEPRTIDTTPLDSDSKNSNNNPLKCSQNAGIDTAALSPIGPGAIRATHNKLFCGTQGSVEADQGPPANRINLILIGDGYTESELTSTWPKHIQNALDIMFGENTEPYGTYKKYINICRLNVASSESGVSIAAGNWPPSNYTYSEEKETAFDGICNEENRRATVNTEKVREAMAQILEGSIDIDWVGVVLNTNKWCNTAGVFAHWAGYTPYLDIAFHEAGHAWHGLADEYGGSQIYTGEELSFVNVTIEKGSKWTHWEGFEHEHPDLSILDWYEGAHYHNYGIYRPSLNGKMNWPEYPHNVVGIEKIVLDIYDLVRPVDAWTDNRSTLTNPCKLELKLVDASLLDVEWFVNNNQIQTKEKETLFLEKLSLPPGTHTIKAIITDNTLFVRRDLNKLQQNIKWTIKI